MPLSPKAKRFAIIGGVLIALLVVATPFLWQVVKQKRAINLAEDAQAQVEEKNYGAAWEAAKAAYALDPENPEVARTLAGIVNQASPLDAPGLWEKTYALSGEEEDLLEWFDSVMRLQDEEQLNAIAQRLMHDFPHSPDALFRRAEHALINKQPERAIELARQAAAAPGASIKVQFAYVSLSQGSEDEAVRATGIAWLRQMAQRTDEIGLKAARELLNAPILTPEEQLAAAQNLAEHPLAEREDKLAEISIRRKVRQQAMEEILAEVKGNFNLEDPAELVEIGRWLNQHNRPNDFLTIVDLDAAVQRKDLLLVWLDSMALSGQWEQLEKIIERPRLPLEPFTVVLFRSRIQQELGNDRLSDLIWGQALIKANEDISMLTFAYEYALKLGWTERAQEVLEKLALLPASQRRAFEEMISLAQRSGDIDALQSALARMAEKYPNDTDVANDLAYINLLKGEHVEQSLQTASQLIQDADRPYLANIITFSLGLYKAGKPDLALQQLYTLPINWSEVRPRHRAIYAAILAANGHKQESQSIMEGVNADQLLPAERALLKDARM
ncbi:hypothetical protein [Cerasicoccus maritimus]|uniref:hypothetical protein n=1 Tax=Cerasicoccus maritimus TaxID=490089 RepID=UPI0028526DE3|nr:hypothetical protein [Cerasicoccus maritimus]